MSNPFRPRRSLGPLLFPIGQLPLLMLLVLAIYMPGLGGGFYLDDFAQILYNPYLQNLRPEWNALKAAVLTSTSGPTGRPVSMLTFAVGQLLHGLDPALMKLTNVLIHLFNGVLLYILLKRLLPSLTVPPKTRTSIPALFLTTLWLAHPLHVSTVLYVVQRMTLLSASFILLGLIGYCRFRCRPRPHLPLALASLLGAALIATLAKENGVLALAYAAIIEIFVLRFRDLEPPARRLLQGLFLWLPLLGATTIALYWLVDPGWFARAYAHRNFDVVERLLTEARALVFYQRLIVLPDLWTMGLYHDDFPLSKSLLDPPTTLLAVLWHGFLLGAAWGLRHKIPLFSFGVAWFYASHLLESTIIPLELVFEHRNYLAAAGLLLALYGLLIALAARLEEGSRLKPYLVPSALTGLTMIFLTATAIRTADWGDLLGHALMEAKRHPISARSQFEAGQALARGLGRNPKPGNEQYEQAREYYWNSARLAPQAIAPLVAILELDGTTAHKLDDQVIAELAHRLRYGKPIASTGLNLNALMRLILERDDLFSKKQVLTLFDAALNNPKLGNRNRANVLVGKALYLKGQQAPLATVIALLSEAATLMPNRPDYRLLLAAFQIDAGAKEQAMQTLNEVEKLDVYKVFEENAAKLRQRIQSQSR